MNTRVDTLINPGEADPLDPEAFLRSISTGAKTQFWRERQRIFSQGDPAANFFYIHDGRIRLTLFSSEGRAATIAILGKGDLLGEECLTPACSQRMAHAIAITDCSFIEIDKERMLDALDRDRNLARSFTHYLLACKIRTQEDLAERLTDSSEQRLVRVLLLLAGPERHGTNGRHSLPEISQEVLAEIVGTTRPRISYFMTKFKKLGFIDYSRGLQVSKELERLLR